MRARRHLRPSGARLVGAGLVWGLSALVLAACAEERPPRFITDSGPRDAAGDGRREPDACERIVAAPDELPPNVLLVLDRSGSMYYGDVDRWNPAVQAVNALVASLEDRIRFGLFLFGNGIDGSCGPGELVVTPTLRAGATIRNRLTGNPADLTGGGTPAADALRRSLTVARNLRGKTYVVLITDGAPNCNFEPDGRTECVCSIMGAPCQFWPECLDDARTVEAVENLARAGVGTYVVGYDVDEWSEVLDRLAAAGGTPFPNYLPVSDRSTLETALGDIAQTLASCSFSISAIPPSYRYVRVRLDGTDLTHASRNPDSGWELVGETTIELKGRACTAFQNGDIGAVEITVECEPVIVI